MSQFALYKNEDPSSNELYPYFIDVQHHLLEDLNSRMVIPLSEHKTLNETDVKRLCPILNLNEGSYVLLTHQMTSVPKSILKNKITSLKNYRYEIMAAIDFLISGV